MSVTRKTRRLAPQIFVSAIFYCLLLIPVSLHAQENATCGKIISAPGQLVPIEDCANPFNADESLSVGVDVYINGEVVANGDRVFIDLEAATVPVSLSISGDADFPAVTIFYHDGADYRVVGGTQAGTEGVMTVPGSGTYSAVVGLYAEDSSGTSTPQVTFNTVLQQIRQFLLPRAYAFLPDDMQVKQITFTIEMDDGNNPPAVLFLPGIKASRLYTERVIGTEDQLWEATINQDVSQLSMTEEGVGRNGIYSKDVIDTAYGTYSIYSDYLDYLEVEKSNSKISAWTTFAYDWRYDVYDIVETGTQYEDERVYPVAVVEQLASESDSKVTIVAHSNGGLLAKALVQKLEAEGKANLVDRIVFLGSPQLGTPKSIGSILHGYGEEILGGLIVNDETAREVMRNMPGAYGLLPTAAFFERASDSVITFNDSDTAGTFIDAYGTTIDSLGELIEFMNGEEGRGAADTIYDPIRTNKTMLHGALAAHEDQLDDWVAPDHIEIIEIVGVGLDTVRGFRYEEFSEERCIFGRFGCRTETYLKPVPLFTQAGDKTVMAVSADAYPGEKETYYFDMAAANVDTGTSFEHATLTESPYVQELLTEVLQGEAVDVDHVSTTIPTYSEMRDVVSVHSPIALRVTDSEGRELGVEGDDDSQRVVSEIPGATYLEFAGGKYAVVPSDSEYDVVFDGEDDGVYTIRIDQVSGDSESEPVFSHSGNTTNDTTATFSKTNERFTPLSIDIDGDGHIEEEVVIDETVTAPVAYTYEGLRSAIEALDLRHWYERQLLLQVRTAERFSERTSFWIFARTEGRLLDTIKRTVRRHERRGRVTENQYDQIKDIIKELKK